MAVLRGTMRGAGSRPLPPQTVSFLLSGWTALPSGGGPLADSLPDVAL